MKNRFIAILIIISLQVSVLAVFAGGADSGSGMQLANEAYIRTDSLTATNTDGTAKITSKSATGVTAAHDDFLGGNATLSNDIIKLQSGSYITLQFDLPTSATGGQIRFLGTIPADATVSIENADSSFYTFNTYNYERPARGVYFYSFGNSTWVDNQKRVRIKVTAGVSGVMIHSAMVYVQAPVISSTTTIRPLSQEELLYARYYSISSNYYFDNGNIPTVFTNNGFEIYAVKVSTNVDSLSYNYDGLVNGTGSFNLAYKDANDAVGFTGAINYFTITSSNSGYITNFKNITIMDPDGIGNSGDEFRELFFMVYGNEFLKSLTLIPVKDSDVTNNSNSAYIRTDSLTASNSDKTALIYSKSLASISVTHDDFLGGNASFSNNVIKVTTGGYVTLQFDMPITSIGGQIRLLGTIPSDAIVSIENAFGSYSTLPYTDYERPARGVYFFSFGNSTWVDNKHRIRIKISAGSNEVMLHSALVYNGTSTNPIDSETTITPLSEQELAFARYYSAPTNYYINNGTTPSVFTNKGIVIYTIKIRTSVDKLSYNYDGIVNGGGQFGFAYKDANDSIGFTGDAKYYTITSSNSGNIINFTNVKVIDPDGILNSGDEYKELLFMAYGDEFLKSLTISTNQAQDKNTTSVYLKINNKNAVNTDSSAKVESTSTSNVTISHDNFLGGNPNVTNDVMKLTSGGFVVLQFQLPDDTRFGQIRFLGTIPKSSTVALGNSDGTYTQLSANVNESPARGVYFYSFNNTIKVDGKNYIKIKITSAVDEVMLHSALAFTGKSTNPIDNEILISPLSAEELLYSTYYSALVDYYFENGITPTVFTNNGFMIYNIRVKSTMDKLVYSFESSKNNASPLHLAYKDANDSIGFTGDIKYYNALSSKIGEIRNLEAIKIIDPDNIADSGDEYRDLTFIFHGNAFLKSFQISPMKKVYSDATYNTISVPANEPYSYFKTGTKDEQKYMFISKNENIMNFSNSNMVIYKNIGGTDTLKVNNARKIQQSQNAEYEFDLPDNTQTNKLKLEASENLKLEYSIDNGSTYSILGTDETPISTGYYIYNLSAENVLSSDNISKKFRVRISSTKKDAFLMSVCVQSDDTTPVTSSLVLSNQTEDGIKYLYETLDTQTFYNSGYLPTSFITGEAYNTYKVTLDSKVTAANTIVTWCGHVKLEVSSDGVTWFQIFNKSTPANGIMSTAVISLNNKIVANKSIYIKVSSGSGGLFVDNIALGISKTNFAHGDISVFSADEASLLYSITDSSSDNSGPLINTSITDKYRAISNGASLIYKLTVPASSVNKKFYLVTDIIQGSFEISISNNSSFIGAKSVAYHFDGKEKVQINSDELLRNNRDIYIKIKSTNELSVNVSNYLAISKISIYADGTVPALQPSMASDDYNAQLPKYVRPTPPKVPQYGSITKGVDIFDSKDKFVKSIEEK